MKLKADQFEFGARVLPSGGRPSPGPLPEYRARVQRRGFAFTEVLFAVMVLGIGFIMIAAMFPVTIKQTQSTLEESVGASTAREAIAYLQTQATEFNFPATGVPNSAAQVVSMPLPVPPLPFPQPNPLPQPFGWYATRGNYINAKNPRVAWVPMYRRDVDIDGVPSPYAQVFIVVTQARNVPQYVLQPAASYSDIVPQAGFQSALEPRLINVKLSYDTTNLRGQLTITDFPWLAAPGAYVIIANDVNPPAPGKFLGQSNGRIYRLGNAIDETNGIWSLAPDGDMIRSNYLTGGGGTAVTGDDNDLANTNAFIVGRGYTDPSKPGNGPDFYSGPAQDIAVYTGFIRINPQVTTP